MPSRAPLGVTIRTMREAKGWTQEQLAAKARMQRPYLTMLETNVKKNPSLDVLKRIAKALGVNVADLLE